jgi:tRNA-dihydrouridine synthase B
MKIGNIEIEGEVVVAPMAGITDKAFRLILKSYGCGLLVTEMVSAKALFYNDKKTKEIMDIDEREKPISMQIFGSDPELMGGVVYNLNNHNNDIIDINMGCPAPKIVKNGDGSALMKDTKLASEIIKSVVKNSIKPVTVKIRSGWDESSINAVEFAKMVESAGADALAIHGRTREQHYTGKADWNIIKEVKKNITIPVIANGDVFTLEDAINIKNITNADAIMIARGIKGKPWLVKKINHYFKTGEILDEPTLLERLMVLEKQFMYMNEFKGERISVLEIRKHASWYLKGIDNAASMRNRVNTIQTTKEFFDIINEIKSNG